MTEEHWKPIKGYEGLYEVSDKALTGTLRPQISVLKQENILLKVRLESYLWVMMDTCEQL